MCVYVCVYGGREGDRALQIFFQVERFFFCLFLSILSKTNEKIHEINKWRRRLDVCVCGGSARGGIWIEKRVTSWTLKILCRLIKISHLVFCAFSFTTCMTLCFLFLIEKGGGGVEQIQKGEWPHPESIRTRDKRRGAKKDNTNLRKETKYTGSHTFSGRYIIIIYI